MPLLGAAAILLATLVAGCAGSPDEAAAPAASRAEPGEVTMNDPHSYAEPDKVAVSHISLDLEVDFTNQRLSGRASVTLKRFTDADSIVLDTRDMDIHAVYLDDVSEPTAFELAAPEAFMGSSLRIPIEADTKAKIQDDEEFQLIDQWRATFEARLDAGAAGQ